MTPELAAAVVRRWVRLYTSRLPDPLVARRVDEIRADLHDHVEYERSRGTGERSIAVAVLSRMARGMPADLLWRQGAHPTKGDSMKPFVGAVGAAIVLAVLALVLDSPPLVLASVALLAAVTLGTFVTSARSAHARGSVGPFVATLGGALGLAAVGVVAIIVGDRGDAPGLVLLGVTLISCVVVGALAFGMRTPQRST
jgi:hypothetical protein